MSDIVDDDSARLHSLGYAQELKRGMGTFSNLAISFSIISIQAGGFTSSRIGAICGGLLVITLGWVIVGLMALFVGMSMGEICSVYPTAGGLCFRSAKPDRNNNALWAWFAGWFPFIGQIGVIASVAHVLANYIVAFVNLYGDISAWSGGFSTLYVFFIGFLLARYTITRFDASAHVSEETVGARIGAPKAIVRSIYTSAIAALVLNWGSLLAVQSVDGKDRLGEIANTSFITAPAAIFAESGISTALVKPFVLIPVVGALSLIQQDGYPVALFALTGICVVGPYISYVIPILLRLRNPDFVQGPGT